MEPQAAEWGWVGVLEPKLSLRWASPADSSLAERCPCRSGLHAALDSQSITFPMAGGVGVHFRGSRVPS